MSDTGRFGEASSVGEASDPCYEHNLKIGRGECREWRPSVQGSLFLDPAIGDLYQDDSAALSALVLFISLG